MCRDEAVLMGSTPGQGRPFLATRMREVWSGPRSRERCREVDDVVWGPAVRERRERKRVGSRVGLGQKTKVPKREGEG